jgi:hypothetical protein
MISGSAAGPLVQLDVLLGPWVRGGGSAFVSVAEIERLAAFIGWSPNTREADTEKLAQALRERDAAQEAHQELLDAVCTTLQHGAVIRHGAIDVRYPYDRLSRRKDWRRSRKAPK